MEAHVTSVRYPNESLGNPKNSSVEAPVLVKSPRLYAHFVMDSQKGFVKKNIFAGIAFGFSAGTVLS